MSDFPELLKPNRVTDSELQTENQRLLIELGNLTAENQKVRADYAALLESSTHVTNKLRGEVQELRSQLEQEKTKGEEMWEELENSEKACKNLRAEVSDLKQKLAAARKLPDAADLLNQLKSKRKKSKADLTDLEVILEILEGS